MAGGWFSGYQTRRIEPGAGLTKKRHATAISASLLSSLFLLLTWAAPTLNCDGTPLTDLAGYLVSYGDVWCVDSGCSSNQPTTVSAPTSWTSASLPIPYDPQLGEVVWWRVDAVDGAGNLNSCGEDIP